MRFSATGHPYEPILRMFGTFADRALCRNYR